MIGHSPILAANAMSQSRPWHPLRRALGVAVLFLPYAGLGVFAAVAVHEVVGHGLTAEALGGTFRGVLIDFDSHGRAFLTFPPREPDWTWMAILLGGVVSTSIVGILLLSSGLRWRGQPALALPLLILAFNCLLEGPAYAFWNAVRPGNEGDIAEFLALASSPAWRPAILIVSGLLMVASIWTMTALLFQITERWIAEDGQLRGVWRLALLLLVFGALPGGLWFAFDWNGSIPGIGALPSVVGAGLHMSAAVSLYWIRFRPCVVRPSARALTVSAILGWAAVTTVVFVAAVWLRHGLCWA